MLILEDEITYQGRVLKQENLVLTLNSDYITSVTAKSIVPGMSFDVISGKKYLIKIIGANQAPATNRSGRIGFILTSGTGNIYGFLKMQTTSTNEVHETIRAISSNEALVGSFLASNAVPVANQNTFIIGEIIFECLTDGVFQLVWGASNAGTNATLKARTTMIIKEL